MSSISGGGGGAMVKLATTTLGGAALTFDVNLPNISAFKQLKVIAHLKPASGSVSTVTMLFNAINSASYAVATSINGGAGSPQSFAAQFYMGTNANADTETIVNSEINIQNIIFATTWSYNLSAVSTQNDTPYLHQAFMFQNILYANAFTSIRFSSTFNIAAGSTIDIYGII